MSGRHDHGAVAEQSILGWSVHEAQQTGAVSNSFKYVGNQCKGSYPDHGSRWSNYKSPSPVIGDKNDEWVIHVSSTSLPINLKEKNAKISCWVYLSISFLKSYNKIQARSSKAGYSEEQVRLKIY